MATAEQTKLISLIRRVRIDLSSEKAAQADIEKALGWAEFLFEREVVLAPRDIVDFMVGDVAIEVKIKGARKMDVFRQLLRYADSTRVSSIILASNLSMGLPETINGKPAFFVRLGEAWI